MAPAIGEKGGPIRVFVLVDKGAARGVFLSWDAAETYADEHQLSLDHLHEFVTRSSHPEHLHLLAAEWESGWEFQGEWKKEIPKWNSPPRRVRLDHYHLRGNTFLIFRQKEFTWSTGLLLKIDPMAPDMVLDRIGSEAPVIPAKPAQQWRPKLGALKGPILPVEKPVDIEPEVAKTDTGSKLSGLSQVSLSELPEEEILPLKKPSPEDSKPDLKPTQPVKPRLVKDAEKPMSYQPTFAGRLSLRDKQPTAQKRKPLKLRSKGTPKPIPDFAPIAPPPELPSTISSVELAQMDQGKVISPESPEAAGNAKKVIPLRLIIAMAAAVIGWGGGVFWVFRPQPTAQEIVVTVAALNPAEVLTIEPGQVFFQLPVDPIYQQRWVRSLNLDPIPKGESVPIPTHHSLTTWSEPDKFIRPPYADVEVREWWDLRLRDVKYGFTLSWEDGSIMILDLESDMMIGWMRAKHLPTVLN